MADTLAQQFRHLLQEQQPLKIVGAINAYCGLMAKSIGHQALYLSGSGVAAASYGLPDLGFTTLEDVLIDARRIIQATQLPLLVDIDTGFDDVAKTINAMIKANVAAVHMEDQLAAKRCGHRDHKRLVSCADMVLRLEHAVLARAEHPLYLIARTDALASEGLAAAIERAQAYQAAGADAIFAEAVTELDQYQAFAEALDIPVLANITEFGKTPLFAASELAAHGVAMVLYPLTAFRAMNQAAATVYQTLHEQESIAKRLDILQDRETLYRYLDYYRYEQEQDAKF